MKKTGHEKILERFDNMKKDESPMGPCRMKIKKPLVAAIEGACVAGGLELALMADIRIGAESSFYGKKVENENLARKK